MSFSATPPRAVSSLLAALALSVSLSCRPPMPVQQQPSPVPGSPEGAATPGGTAGTTTESASRQRARALVREMTLEEKTSSLVHVFDWSYQKSAEQLCAAIPAGAGSFERIGLKRDAAATATFVNELSACVKAKSRLHIPPFFLDEGVHGLMQQGGTNFPVALALGATFNPDLVEQVFAVVAREARSRG